MTDARPLAFWGIALFIISMALARLPAVLDPWDRELHFLAFYILGCAAMVSFPRTRTWRLALALIAGGVALESAQMLPIFGHAAELSDLAANLAGIAAALVPMRLAAWRRRRQEQTSPRSYSV